MDDRMKWCHSYAYVDIESTYIFIADIQWKTGTPRAKTQTFALNPFVGLWLASAKEL